MLQAPERIWLKNYPQGVPTDISLNEHTNLVQLIDHNLQKYATLPAYSNMGKTLTFEDINQKSTYFAAFLQQSLKLQPGDRIAIMMPNCLQYPIALFGALKAGLVVVNTNPLYTPREMEHQFNDSEAKAIVIIENFACNLQKIIQNTKIQHVITTSLGDLLGFPKSIIVNTVVKYVKKMVPAYALPTAIPFNTTLTTGKNLPLKTHQAAPNDVAMLQYTGGTTGVSKGAMLTHQNMLANMEQISAWMASHLKEGQETMITALPLYHIFAFTVNCLTMLKAGAHNVLITNPRDLEAFIKDLQKYKFTVFTGVNTLFNALLNHPKFNTIDFSHLKVSVGGGMAVQKVVAEKWKTATNCYLCEGYGLTESSPVLTVNPLNGTGRIGYIGLPVPSTYLSLVDDDGNPVPMGEVGEIIAKGPQVMLGYYNRPDETAKVIKNGWLYTGDMGVIDSEGFIKIVDRKKDMILVSGFNVYPNEVEDVVALHPGVLEVAAVGVPDEKSGEAVKIFVVKKDPNLTEKDLIKHCQENLTAYKIPRQVEFKTELPKTNVGKILRRMLKE